MACCPMGDFCRGTISHESGSGTGINGDGGATQGVGAVATMGATPGGAPGNGGIIIVDAGTVRAGGLGLAVRTMLAGLILDGWAIWM